MDTIASDENNASGAHECASRRPVDVCAGLRLGTTARVLLEGNPSPAEYLTALLQSQCHADAVKYLAHALPKTEAVKWACVCVRIARSDGMDAVEARVLAAAEAWALAPGAGTCRAASAAAAETVPNDRGARFAALAASWSGESLAPEGLPLVPPPQHLTGEGAAAAVMIAATSGDPGQIDEAYRNFIARGILIARRSAGIAEL